MKSTPVSTKAATVTGPMMGMRYSRLLTRFVSPPGKMICSNGIATFVDGDKFLILGNRFDVPDVAAETRKFGGHVQALSRMWTLRVVDLVIRKIRDNLTGDDAVQGVRAGDAAEGQGLKII